MPTLGTLGQVLAPYRPTYAWDGAHIDDAWRALGELPLSDEGLIQMQTRRWFGKTMRGWLRREDALKLYELAFFTKGDILELGCYHGLSTTILARACRNTDPSRRIYTCDLRADRVAATMKNLARYRLDDLVHAEAADAIELTRRMAQQGKRFEFAFIDHSHAYSPVLEVCKLLDAVIAPGGWCYFHDFNDARNAVEDIEDYGVYQAVMEGLPQSRFQFYGTYGCAALFRG